MYTEYNVVPQHDGEKNSTVTESFSDDRHGLMRDLNSNAVWDISDLCLTPSRVKTTRPTPLINVMFSLFLSLPFSLSIPLSSQVRLLNGRIHYREGGLIDWNIITIQ